MEYTPQALIKKLGAVINLEDGKAVPYKLWKMAMMGYPNLGMVMTYERTVKEKYQLMIDLGFISKTGIFNMGAYLEQCGE